jgi:glycosyltransferase involved in cell wall biosynthesis
MSIKNKHVLFISYDGLTDPLGQSQVLPYLIGLSKSGYSIAIISAEKADKYDINKTLITELCNAATIQWLPVFYTKKPPILSTVWDMYKIYKKAIRLYNRQPYALVHCRSYLSAIVGSILKKKTSCKMLFDIRGFWADERLDGKTWNNSNPAYWLVYRYFKKKEVELFEQADGVISLTHNAKKEIVTQIAPKVEAEKITVIPCCADLALFDKTKISKESQHDFRKEFGIAETDFVLSYLGSVGTWYRLDEMFNFFGRLLLQKPNSKFLIISASDPAYILSVMQQQNIPRDSIIITKAARKDVAAVLSLSHCSIFFYDQVYSIKACSPTKQGEIMSLGIPIICNDGIGDTSAILKKHEAGVIVSDFTINAYDKAINYLLTTLFDAAKIQAAAHEEFDLVNGVNAYEKTYEKMLSTK